MKYDINVRNRYSMQMKFLFIDEAKYEIKSGFLLYDLR